ncbi:MAG: hypothetical protein ACC700_15875 [Anaerolineales bacterium]
MLCDCRILYCRWTLSLPKRAMKQKHKRSKDLVKAGRRKSGQASITLVRRGLDLADSHSSSEIRRSKNAQLLSGTGEEHLYFRQHLKEALLKEDFQVRTVSILDLLQAKQNQIAGLLSEGSDLSVLFSAISWCDVAEHVPSNLLPNPLVITSNPMIPDNCEIKPAAIVQWKSPFPTAEILSAAQHLMSGMTRFPRRGATFGHAEFGSIRRAAVTDPQAIRAWETLHERVRTGPDIKAPGQVIKAWSAEEGDQDWSFEISQLNEDRITIRSSGILGWSSVPKEDFCLLAGGWDNYKSKGELPGELRDRISSYSRGMARFFGDRTELYADSARYLTYMTGMLRWLDEEGEI